MRLRRLVTVCVLLSCGHESQAEKPAKRVERLAREAGLAYRLAEYSRAAALLESAYRIRQVAALLYNAAKAYEKLGLLNEARDRYRRYLEANDAEPRLRTKVAARMAILEREREAPPPPEPPKEASATEHAASLTSTPAIAPPMGPAGLLLSVQKAPLAKSDVRTTPDPSGSVWQNRSRGRERDRILGSTLSGAGLAVAGVGAGLSVSAYLLHRQFAGTFDEARKRDLKRSAEVQALGGDLAYGLASVSTALGIYFLLRGIRPEAPPRQIALVPAIPWRGAELLVEGRF